MTNDTSTKPDTDPAAAALPDRDATAEAAFQAEQAPRGALSGVRVLDMSRVVAGPLAAQILADLGADVIKVERPEGEDLRTLGPPWVTSPMTGAEQSTYFQTVNRGKRSLTIDFAKPEGAEIVRRLAGESDVVIENFRTGTLAKYGLGYEALSTINPGLIYCSITGFGQHGPYSERSAYDYLVQAMGGQMSITGYADDAAGAGPMRVAIPIADISAGNNAAIAILAALQSRSRDGKGQHLDIALLDSQVAILLNSLSSWLNTRTKLPKTGNDHQTAVPNGVYHVADGFMLISTFNDREFARLAGALGHPEWAEDARFARSRNRLTNRDELRTRMAEVLIAHDRAHWMERLNQAKVSCGPINDMADLEHDPQLLARGMFLTMNHPVMGDIRIVGSPLKLSRTPVRYERPPPLPGEHTLEILSDVLELSQQDIDDLKQANLF